MEFNQPLPLIALIDNAFEGTTSSKVLGALFTWHAALEDYYAASSPEKGPAPVPTVPEYSLHYRGKWPICRALHRKAKLAIEAGKLPTVGKSEFVPMTGAFHLWILAEHLPVVHWVKPSDFAAWLETQQPIL